MEQMILILVVFLANVIEGITGFAGTMLAMPAAIRLIGIEDARIVLNIVAIVVSLSIAVTSYREMNKREVVKISCFMIVGMLVGLLLMSLLPTAILTTLYGLFIIVVALRGLSAQRQIELSKPVLVIILILAGIIHGIFLSGGALLVLYVVNTLKDKTVIRGTLAPVWIVLNTVLLLQNIMAGQITLQIMKLSGICVIPVLLAIVLGNILHHAIRQESFIKLTYVLLIISGGTLLL